jgi:ribonuclease HII
MIGEEDVREWLDGAVIIGVDEAGKGPIAGHMFIGAAILNPKASHLFDDFGIKDSKKIAEKKRFAVEQKFLPHSRCAVGIVSIDDINSGRNLDTLWGECAAALINELAGANNDVIVFIDGNRKVAGVDARQIVKPKFDGLSWSVAAASIIAKNAQVKYMLELDKRYPEYEFSSHKGYGTNKHYQAINKFGICSVHRKYWIK